MKNIESLLCISLVILFLCPLYLKAKETPPKTKDTLTKIQSEIRKLAKTGNKEEALLKIQEGIQQLGNSTEGIEASSNLYFFSGNLFFNLKWTEEAEKLFNQALDNRKQLALQKDSLIGDIYNNLAIINDDNNENAKAIEFHLKALEYRTKAFGKLHIQPAKSLTNLAIIHEQAGDYFTAMDFQNQAITVKRGLVPIDTVSLISSYAVGGVLLGNQGDFQKAELYYDTALTFGQHLDPMNQQILPFIKIYRANNYYSQGRYSLALIELNNILKVFEASPDYYVPEIIEINLTLSIIQEKLGNYEQAFRYTQRSLDILEQVDPDRKDYRWAYAENSLGNTYEAQKKWDKALIFFKKALNSLTKYRPGHPDIAAFHFNVGAAYSGLEKYQEAQYYYKTALDLWENSYKEPHPFIANGYHHLITVYDNLGDHQEANKMALRALEANSYNGEDYTTVKDLSILWSTLSKQAIILKNKYYQVNDLTLLEEANKKFIMAVQVMDYQKRIAKDEDFSLNEGKTYHQVFEHAVETNFLLYQKTKKSDYLDQAFFFSEKSKAFLLLESTKAARALSYSGVDPETIQMEIDLRSKINSLKQKRTWLFQNDSPDQGQMEEVNRKLYEHIDEHHRLIQQIEDQNPRYFNLKYADEVIDIYTIQNKLLTNNQALIEYFVGDNAIYVFKIDQRSSKLIKLDQNFDLSLAVSQFREYIRLPHKNDTISTALIDHYYKHYTEHAVLLYQKLLEPLDLQTEQSLLIIPDGELGYLPFEALIKTVPKNYTQFSKHHYLVLDHSIKYCYSMTMYQEMNLSDKRRNSLKPFLGIGLSFRNATKELPATRANLLPNLSKVNTLLNAVEEVESIWALFPKGDMLKDDQVTKEVLLSIIDQYQIVHFATHGITHDRATELSSLLLSLEQPKEEDWQLFIREIYSLAIQSDLVVMSACQTGLGPLHRGEGIISLARAFSYAGAKEVIPTLWSINDKRTKELMLNFYTQVNKGQNIEQALRSAKIKFIEDCLSPNLAHPYYWAAFIDIGGGTKNKGSIIAKWAIFGICITGLFLLLFWRIWRKN